MSGAETILEVFENRVNESSTRPALRRRVDGVWTSMSWKEWWEAAERVAAGLIEVGVQPGDRVAILSETRVEWLVCDIAVEMLGGITVPIYPSLGPRLVGHILRDCGAVAAIVADPVQLDKVLAERERQTKLRDVFWIEPEAVRAQPDFRGRRSLRLDEILDDDDPWNRSLEDLAASGRRLLAQESGVVSQRRRAVRSDDTATIVYTSGTLAEPRGVTLTQRNLVTQVAALADLELFSADDVQVLFLPLAHVFARVLYLAAVGYGIETVIVEDMRHLLMEMQEVEPTFFAGVPQLFDQVRAKLERDAAQGPLREQLFRVAERIGQSTDRARRSLTARGLVDRVGRSVLERIQPDRARQVFGGRVRFAISGGAPLSPDTTEFFATFGLEVLEGYGLTETTAVATVNVPGDNRIGSVGRPLQGVDITIDEDGEVLVRGPSVSPGYWGDEAATRASRDEEGWFRTGDLGEFDRDGFLHITGRKKEIIVTAGGKKVAPNPVEAKLESVHAVDRVFLYGDRMPYVVALLTLQPAAVAAWASERNLSPEEVPHDEAFVAALDEAVSEMNAASAGYANLRRWAIVPNFTEERGELTATGKLRRTTIAELHADTLASLYGDG